MMDITIKELQKKFLNKELKVLDFVKDTYKKIKENDLNAYISLNEEDSLKKAEELDERIDKGDKLGRLFGVTIAIKDNISCKDMRMTCGSRTLENFKALFDASVIEKLKKEDAIIIGKTNMDEFAMGSSSETSYFGPCKNPLDKELIPGGSSSGSCATVGAGEVVFALGSDTGGSTRQPASYCGVLGYYPTYGSISRYGIVSMANSLDQVGLIGNRVEDIELVRDILKGKDYRDPNSIVLEDEEFDEENLSKIKIAILDSQAINIDERVKEDFNDFLKFLEDLGIDYQVIDLKMLKYVDAIYNICMNSEVASNMARFDGIRYGYHTDEYDSFEDFYKKSRSEGFGEEVKRRIVMGYLLTSKKDNQEKYKKGLKARKLLRDEMDRIFEDFDFVISPTASQFPWKIGTRSKDPMAVYESGTFNVIANLSSLPAISIPFKKGINRSVQVMAKRGMDSKLLGFVKALERRNNL